MHVFQINILIFNFDVFYIFRTRGFISRKAVGYRVMVWYVLHTGGKL
jgi:hypothetical protein